LSERAEADERRRHLQAVAAVEPFADAERLVEQGPSLVEKAKLGVDAPQGVEKPGLEEGLGPELLAHPLGAAPQELAGIRRRAPGLPRIRGLEQPLQELCLLVRPLRLELRTPCLSAGGDEAAR